MTIEVTESSVLQSDALQAMRRLRELGCLLGQGHFFGEPAPLEEIEHLLQPPSPLERLATSA